METTPEQSPILSHRVQRLIPFAVLLMICLFIVIRLVFPVTDQMSYGFIGRYTASLLLVQGEFGPQVYQDDWFIEQVSSTDGLQLSEIFTPNPPTLSLLTIPFVWLPPRMARDAWLWANLGVLLGTLGLLLAMPLPHSHRLNRKAVALSLALLAVIPALAANFRVGQVYILLLCLFTLALGGLISRREWLAGAALGLAFVLKTSGLPLWLLLLALRRWRALVWGLGTMLAVVLTSLPWIGLETWLAYPPAVWNFSGQEQVAATAYQTTAGFFTHLLQFDPVWSPQPLLHWPVLARLLTLLVSVVALAVTLWLGRDQASPVRLFAALVPLSVILLPVAEAHHFVLLLLPMFLLLTDLLNWKASGAVAWLDRLLLGSALFLLLVPLPYKDPAPSASWLAWLAYPRLFGGWLLWAAAVRALAAGRETAG